MNLLGNKTSSFFKPSAKAFLIFIGGLLAVVALTVPASSQHTLWYEQPAENWNEALPVGNGRLGGMVFGGVHSEQITLNEESIWTGQPIDREMPNAGSSLHKVRELLFQEKYAKAENLVQEKMMSDPIEGHAYQVLGDLFLDFDHPGESISGYRRELNLKTAIARVSYHINDINYSRQIFSSPVDESVVIRLEADKPGNISFSARLARPKDARIQAFADSKKIIMKGQVTGGDSTMQGKHPGVSYEAQLKFTHSGGTLSAEGENIILKNADHATLYLTAETDYRGENPHKTSQEALETVTDKSFEEIRVDHIREHQRLYNRTKIELGLSTNPDLPTDERLQAVKDGETDPGLVEQYFRYGRYLLISSSRPGDLAANLQGLWVEGLTPPWNADYHININTQMNYWPAEVTNLAETHHPFFALIDSLRPRGRITAQNSYNSDGFVAHHTTDAWYWTSAIGEPKWGMWPMSVAWSTQHYWDHFAFNRDTTFLAERAYPVLKEASEFFIDYLVENPQTGHLVTGPSISPENTFKTDDGQEASISMGPTMDIQIVRNLLTNTIDASRTLSTDADFRRTLLTLREKLPPLEVSSDGTLMEWATDFEEVNPGHRHISHLFALYPGNQIAMRETPDYIDAAKKTIERRLEHGGGHTGWSRAWIINFYARLENAEEAHSNVLALLRKSTLSNLFDTHPPFQIDGNFGGTAGIAEMLIQSHTGEIHLLPALPKAWSKGNIDGFRARGGYEVSFSWKEGKIKKGEIAVSKAGTCRIRAGRAVEVYRNGNLIESSTKDSNIVEFNAQAGKVYQLKAREN